ncbi:MAG: hypothetical protein K2X48_08350 [Chitinophagaceae bacterium]|nr:hypothetical protein [Chitinophagaceae bacterium]
MVRKEQNIPLMNWCSAFHFVEEQQAAQEVDTSILQNTGCYVFIDDAMETEL